LAGTTFEKTLIKGLYTYTQITASNTSGEVPVLGTDIFPGTLAFNIPDRTLYGANQTHVFLLLDSAVVLDLFVSNAYAQVTFPTFDYVANNYIANVTGNAAQIPIGNNTNRPSPAQDGFFRYNNELETFEGYVNGNWIYINNPGGPNTAVQFNDSEIFEGSAGFTFDKTTNNVGIANTVQPARLLIGDATVNVAVNSTLLQLFTNTTIFANLSPTGLVVGTAFVNATGVGSGANVFLDTTRLSIGNTIANLIANSILLKIANATHIANLQPSALTIGDTIANNLGLSVGGTGAMVINTTAYKAGDNVVLDATRLFIGNSTVNATMNSTAFALNGTPIGGSSAAGADTQVQFNDGGSFGGSAGFTFTKTTNNVVIANTLTIGTSVVNTTTFAAGANVFLDTVTLSIGNTTANLLANSVLISLANSTMTANLTPTTLQIGTTYVFETFIAVGFPTGSLLTSTALTVGANVSLDTVRLSVGNTIANLIANSILVKVANATGIANLEPTQLTIGSAVQNSSAHLVGTSFINSTAYSTGANVFLDTVKLSIGNTIANLIANSIMVTVANATGIANLQPTQLVIGSALVNTTTVGVGTSFVNSTAYVAGANVFLDTVKLSIGNTIANLIANSIIVTVANATGIANLQPTQLVIGSAVVNSSAHLVGTSFINSTAYVAGANVFLDTVKLSIGNTTANLLANSILISLANSTAISNLQPGLLTIGACSINATHFVGNGAALTSIAGGSALPPGFCSIRLQCGVDVALSNAQFNLLPGKARDSTDAEDIQLTANPLTKNVAASWAVGNNQGGMDTGSVTTSTIYYVYVIKRSDTGVVDSLFSLSPTAPTMPANYDYKQRVGWFRTDAGSRILRFTQDPNDWDKFWYGNTIVDVNVTNLGTTRTAYTLSLPNNAIAHFWFLGTAPSPCPCNPQWMILQPYVETNTSGNSTHVYFQGVEQEVEMLLNTSRQLTAQSSSTSSTVRIRTRGATFLRTIIP
jgi:hypothetical protein